MSVNLDKISVVDLGRALHTNGADAVEVTEYYLERIEAASGSNVFISVSADRARTEAKASADRQKNNASLGPLDGVPIAWKDLIDVEGTITTCGSEIHRNRAPASADAPIVKRAAAAGMVSLGKVNLTEFAFSGIGINPHFGTPHNPHDPKTPRAPGGSSSGSAVAVAMDLAPIAIGTDTGGSVRIPAAFNGLVGFKTSERSIDKSDVQALSLTLDTVGPLGRTVGDCVLMERALRGVMVATPRPAGLEDCRLLVPTNHVLDKLDDAVGANFDAALSKLSAAGVKIEQKKLPQFDAMLELAKRHGTLATAEAYYTHHDLVDGDAAEKMDGRVVSRIRMGKEQSAFDVLSIREGRIALIAALEAELDGSTFIAMPSVAITAPEIAPLDADVDVFFATNMMALRNSMVGNFFNLPGFTIPSGTDKNNMPTGILINAAPGQDEHLICYSLGIEKVLSV